MDVEPVTHRVDPPDDAQAARFERLKYAPRVVSFMHDQSGRRKRQKTGGRRRPASDKKRNQLGREPAETTVGDRRLRTVDARGTETKVRALSTDVAQVADAGETTTEEILNVVENPADVNYARRNIVTKGAILETEAGRARVTSRPGQTGQVNAVRVDD